MKFSEHITTQHRARKAMVYIRQSSPGQVRNNVESQELQLALKQRAIDFGWPSPCIEVIDCDLGLTGTGMAERQGMQYLITQVAKNEVGIVWCWDVSRMSRNCSDWFPFLDVCAFKMVLIGDRDGIYDPITPNGRCMLGIKGQFAELEMNAIRARLNAGLWNKAKRGELFTILATGFVCDALGRVHKDPDIAIQNAIQNVFDMFLKLGTSGKVLRFFLSNGLKLPRRNSGELIWKSPSSSAILSILRNPVYAGASVYGRNQSQIIDFQTKKRKKSRMPVEDWRFLVKDKFPGYISWEVYETIQSMLRQNYSEYAWKETTGIVRKGKALVTGLVYCGACGHKMRIQYDQAKNDARYICNSLKMQYGGSKCQNILADPVDEFAVTSMFEALSPAELNMFDAITAEQKQQDATVAKMKGQHLERLRYQAKLAERQFNGIDPDNRLVRVELEKRWENALKELSEAEKDAQTVFEKENQAVAIPKELRDAFSDLGKNLPEIWPRLTEEKKKAFLRAMIDKVVIYKRERCTLNMRIVWKGGDTSTKEVWIATNSLKSLPKREELEAKILELTKSGHSDTKIAEILSKEGYHSPQRKTLAAHSVKKIRQSTGMIRRAIKSGSQVVAGFLTINQVANSLQIERSWIYNMMRRGKLEVEKDKVSHAYLFPDSPKTLKKIAALKAGKIENLSFIGASR